MKLGPMSAKRYPRGIITSHGTMAACAQRFDTPARYTDEARTSSGAWSVTSGKAACATLQSPGMAGIPKPPKETRRPAKDDEVISPGAGVAWRRGLVVWARETKALLANPSAHLAVAKLRRSRRYYARSLKLVKATPMPDGERVRRELAETVAAIDDALVKCPRRR